MTAPDPDQEARRLAEASLAADDPTGWFERLYAAADHGSATVPWDRGGPHQLLAQWGSEHAVTGNGRTALVVGCGLGEDAEYVAGLGFRTVAFDVSATAIRSARRRFPCSDVEYVTADLLALPVRWKESFDLVVESLTVQALPESLRDDAIASISRTVGSGGTLLVIAAVRDDDEVGVQGPPWPLTRSQVESFGTGGLRPRRIEQIQDADHPAVRRWRAEFHRPGSRGQAST